MSDSDYDCIVVGAGISECFWPFTAWVFTIGRAWYQPEMQPVDRCLAIIRRTGAAIDDLDSLGAIGM
jgi:hypothetical protein